MSKTVKKVQKKSTSERTKASTLPSVIELITASRAQVNEFDIDHALRILLYQDKYGLGDYKIYNTDLYTYDGQHITIRPSTQGHEESKG